MIGRFFHNVKAPALYLILALVLTVHSGTAAEFTPAPQKFRQGIARSFGEADGLPRERIQLLEISLDGKPQVFAGGRWFKLQDSRWQAIDSLTPSSVEQFAFPDAQVRRVEVGVPWREVRQVVRSGQTNF